MLKSCRAILSLRSSCLPRDIICVSHNFQSADMLGIIADVTGYSLKIGADDITILIEKITIQAQRRGGRSAVTDDESAAAR